MLLSKDTIKQPNNDLYLTIQTLKENYDKLDDRLKQLEKTKKKAGVKDE